MKKKKKKSKKARKKVKKTRSSKRFKKLSFKRKKKLRTKRKIKKIRKKTKKTRPRKNFKKPAFKRQKIGRRRARNVRKKKKKLRIRKKVKRIKITKKAKSLRTSKQLDQLKKLTVKKVLSFILQPIIKAYENFRESRRIKKLKKIDIEKKEKERQIIEEEKLRKQMIESELFEELRIARMRTQDLRRFIRIDQANLRRQQADKKRRFLESIKLTKRIEAYRRRELKQIKHLEMIALKEERDDYLPVLNSIEKIKAKYRLIREQKIFERLKSLGLEVDSTDTKESLLEKQKAYEKNRQQIEFLLEPYWRSANSLVFQINKKFIPKHKSIMRIIDRRYEESMCLIHYDDEPSDDWIILFYLENSNPDKETIVVEDKTNPDKFVTKTFQTREIFAFSDYLVDQICLHIDRERQKKAS